MPIVIGPRFTVKGIEPAAVRAAPPAARRAFWNACSAFVAMAKEIELRNGLDKDGNPMAALAEYTVKHRHSEMGAADPFAPPLQPAHGLSRTRSLFRAQPTARLDGVMCFWGYDAVTAESWGKMLAIHRAGGGKLPARDVIGLSKASVAEVKKKAAAWWQDYVQSGGAVAPPEFAPELEPEPAPKFKVERVPQYKPKFPGRAIPKEKHRISQIKINGHVYTMQSGSAEGIRRGIANKTFSGFGRVTPLPAGGPEAFAPKSTPGAEYLKRSATATPIKPRVSVQGRVQDLRARLKDLAPRVRVAHLPDLVGATGEAKVTAGLTPGGKVFARAVARDYEAVATILDSSKIKLNLVNVPLERQGKGIGKEILAGIVAAAKKARFQEIVMTASRDAGDVGYMVWPKFGFDGPLPRGILARLPQSLRGAKTVRDLYRTAAGRKWWERHGVSIELTLEL